MSDSLTNDFVWNTLAQDSLNFEQSMDSLHRKQTGSYYTALELTYIMMKEMIGGLSEEDKRNLFSKKFLEPCVGTGNFVYAYLRVCQELKFTKEQYRQVLDNIYVCDINKDALKIYKQNLAFYADKIFGISLDNEYFDSHIGSGLMIDVDASSICYIPLEEVFSSEKIGNGFDFVVTNPPYKNLKAERSHYQTDEQYETDKLKYAAIGKLANKYFPYSSSGVLNLYKMFVEEIIDHYAAPNGVCSLLIPASILSDKTCSKIRSHLLSTCSIKSLRIISESSNYVDASQALCAMLLYKGKTTESIYIDGSFSGGLDSGMMVSALDFLDANTGDAILILSNEEYVLRKKMQKFPAIKDIPYIHNLRGELDVTINKDAIKDSPTSYRLYRGRQVGYYEIIETSNIEYVSEEFIHSTAKEKYIHGMRLVCQQIANMAKKRRISFAVVPKESVIANSCNFIAIDENEDNVDYYFLIGVLNSSLIEWFFKLTSSNNHINNYEIDNFPIPIKCDNKRKISKLVLEYIEKPSDLLIERIEKEVYKAYGLTAKKELICSNENINNTSHVNTVFNSKSVLLQHFKEDCSQLIPRINVDQCLDILSDKTTVQGIMIGYGISLNEFESKILLNIEKKYKKLYAGEVLNHTTFKLSDLDLEMIKPVPQGGSWKDIPKETVQKSKRLARITQTGGRTTLYGRIDYSKPSYTITTYFNRPGNGTYVHPVHERVLSVREAARFQCFPDDYFFCGTKTDMLKQVGNAVPVLLAYNIGKSIKEKTGCSTSVDLFSGAGGMTYGFKRAGIKAVIANDIIKNACVTLKTNNPEIPVLCGDITLEETKSTIIDAGVNGKADIICGGPPCQGFSLAGWRMKDDPRNQLFRHFIDIVSGVNPKVIVFENVEGIMSYQGGETYREIIELFSELGYYTEGRKLSANQYGAPQRRKRVIILCTRKDIGVLPKDIFPEPITPNMDRQITAYETIYDLENVQCAENAKYCSNYSSQILKYFKGELDISEYVTQITDPRGVLTEYENVDGYFSEEESLAELNEQSSKERKPIKKCKIDEDEGYKQISIFDLI